MPTRLARVGKIARAPCGDWHSLSRRFCPPYPAALRRERERARGHERTLAAAAGRAHHLPVLRRGLRPAGAAGRLRRRERRRRPRAPRQFRPHLLQGLGAGRDARPRRAPPSPHAAARRRQPRARRMGPRARRGRRRILAHHRARRPRRGRLLSLRAAPHRGLLRRQQADERLHRLGQRRHQFAAVHGLLGRRPPPRLRRRYRARLLRRPRHGRSSRARRLQRRLVPSGAVPKDGQEQARARGEDRGDQSAPHRDRGGRRPPSSHRARHGHGAVLRPAGRSRRPLRARLPLHRRAHRRLREHARPRARSRPTSRRRRARPGCRKPTSRASSPCFMRSPMR